MAISLRPREVHIWHVPPACAQGLDAAAERLLDAREKRRAETLRGPLHSARFRRAHAATRLILTRYGAPEAAEIGVAPGGRPYLAAGGPAFSVSHSGDHAAIAVAREEIGIDIEILRALPNVDALANVVLSPAEREAFGRLRPPARSEALLALWTRKEAVLKAEGLGLSIDPRAVDVGWEGRAAVATGRTWCLVPLNALPAGLVGCVAVPWNAPIVAERVFEADDLPARRA